MVPRLTVQFSPLSVETAIAEKFVVHWPGLPHCLTDMKLTYCVVPTEMPAVGNDGHFGWGEIETVDDLF